MKTFFTGLLLVIWTVSFGQEISYNDGIFSFNEKSRQGVNFVNKFEVNAEVIEKIRTSNMFNKWMSDMENEEFSDGISKLQNLQNNYENVDNVQLFLKQKISSYNYMISLRLKNPDSFKIIENSIGSIIIGEEQELMILENYSSQNGYGNEISSKLYITINLETGDWDVLL